MTCKPEVWESGVERPSASEIDGESSPSFSRVSEIEARESERVKLLSRIMSVSEDGSSAKERK
jgi:hypothetical protein